MGTVTKVNPALAAYPVGSVYMSVNSTSPATLFGGTWEQLKGRFLIGVGQNEANTTDYWGKLAASAFNMPAGEMGGEAWHTLTASEIPAHTHGSKSLTGEASHYSDVGLVAEKGVTSGILSKGTKMSNGYSLDWVEHSASYKLKVNATHTHDSVGGGSAHSNMPPYLAVYMWKRTA